MSDFKINIRLFSGVLGGVFGAFAGNTNAAVVILFMLVLIDLIFPHKSVDIFKKCGLFLFAAAATWIDLFVIKSGFLIKNAVVCFYIANEIISIIQKAKTCSAVR